MSAIIKLYLNNNLMLNCDNLVKNDIVVIWGLSVRA